MGTNTHAESSFTSQRTTSPLRSLSSSSPLSNSKSIRHFAALKKNKKQKMISSLMIVLLALAGSQAAKLTSTGVDLEPIFEFLDNDGSGGVNSDELKELTVAGDEDGDGTADDGEITEAENSALFGKIDADGNGEISLDEFFAKNLFGHLSGFMEKSQRAN